MVTTAGADDAGSGVEHPCTTKGLPRLGPRTWAHRINWKRSVCKVAAILLGCCLLGAAAGYAARDRTPAVRERTVEHQRSFWQRAREGLRPTGEKPAVAMPGAMNSTATPSLQAPKSPRSGPTAPNTIQGVFFDEGMAASASWAGLRVLGGALGDRSGTGITIVGTDDGRDFYTMSGSFLGEKLSIDTCGQQHSTCEPIC